jgi:hypothetical protein
MNWGNVRQAAIACDFPPASWRNWEHYGRVPREYVAVCRKIANVTGVDLAWLAGTAEDDDEHAHKIAS